LRNYVSQESLRSFEFRIQLGIKIVFKLQRDEDIRLIKDISRDKIFV